MAQIYRRDGLDTRRASVAECWLVMTICGMHTHVVASDCSMSSFAMQCGQKQQVAAACSSPTRRAQPFGCYRISHSLHRYPWRVVAAPEQPSRPPSPCSSPHPTLHHPSLHPCTSCSNVSRHKLRTWSFHPGPNYTCVVQHGHLFVVVPPCRYTHTHTHTVLSMPP